MTRVAVCGVALADPAAALGLERVDEHPDVVLVDLGDPQGIALAASVAPTVPRVVITAAEHEPLLRALGSAGFATAASRDAAAIGPLISAAVPAAPSRATRIVVVTSPCGGAGRTLLTVNLASRLAARASVLVLDLTGTGAAGWWLRLFAAPWSDLEGLVEELTAEHLSVIAAQAERLRLIGGGPVMPSAALVDAVLRAAPSLADIVLVDAPLLADERTRVASARADRILVVALDDAAALAALDGAAGEDAWIVASRGRADRLGDRAVLRSLPDDPSAVRDAARGPSAVGGRLGRAYDDLAELLAIDAS